MNGWNGALWTGMWIYNKCYMYNKRKLPWLVLNWWYEHATEPRMIQSQYFLRYEYWYISSVAMPFSCISSNVVHKALRVGTDPDIVSQIWSICLNCSFCESVEAFTSISSMGDSPSCLPMLHQCVITSARIPVNASRCLSDSWMLSSIAKLVTWKTNMNVKT